MKQADAASPIAHTGLSQAPHPTSVFIVGCQRSGSTLLGAMLGRHPNIVCLPEAQFIADLCIAALPGQPLPDLEKLVSAIRRHPRFKLWEFAAEGFTKNLQPESATFADVIHALAENYAGAHARPDAAFWIDQQPGNLRFMARLSAHFPEARMLHIVRDGRAVAASLMPLDWGPNTIIAAARYWSEKIGLGFAAAHFLPADRVLTVRYEDLVRKPEETLSEIHRWLGLTRQAGPSQPSSLQLPRFSQAQHQKIYELPDPARIDAWQTHLSEQQVALFETVSHDLLEYLGYRRVQPLHSDIPTRWQTICDFGENKLRAALNRRRYRRMRGLGAADQTTP